MFTNFKNYINIKLQIERSVVLLKSAEKIIDELIFMILSKNIEYDEEKYDGKETKFDIVKEKIESIERYI